MIHIRIIYYVCSSLQKMKISSILYMCASPTIKNGQLPSCKNCIHFIPENYSYDYATPLSKCKHFGEKDIITDKITNRYADVCRLDETLCGKEGKYFKQDQHVQWKIMRHKAIHMVPYGLLFGIVLLNICARILLPK